MEELFLDKISPFWLRFYKEEAYILEAFLRSQAYLITAIYNGLLKETDNFNLRDYPIYKESFYHILELKNEFLYFDLFLKQTENVNNATFIGIKLDDSYAKIPYLVTSFTNYDDLLVGGEYKDFITAINTLDVGLTYINTYNTSITHNSKIINPNEIFIAETTNFSVAPFSVGGIYIHKDFFIHNKRGEFGSGNSFAPETQESYLIFRKNSVLHKEIQQKKQIKMLAPKVFLDYDLLWKFLGCNLNILANSSINYKYKLLGALLLFTKGFDYYNVQTALNFLVGYPVAKENENIQYVQVTNESFILKSNKNNTYIVPHKEIRELNITENFEIVEKTYRGPVLRFNNKRFFDPIREIYVLNGDFTNKLETPNGDYDVFFPVKKGEGFLENLKLVDYIRDSKWWLEFPHIFDVIQIDGLSDKDTKILDYLFEKALKFNTFGLKFKPEEFIDEEGVKSLFNILFQVKPTYKNFIPPELFRVALSEQGILIHTKDDYYTGVATIPNINYSLDSTINIPDDYESLLPYTELFLDRPKINIGIDVPNSINVPPIASDLFDISNFIAVSSQNSEFIPTLGNDVIGYVDGWVDDLDNPYIGSGFELVDNSYTISRFTINFISDLNVDDSIKTGSFYSISNVTTPSQFLELGTDSEENFNLFGLTDIEGILEYTQIESFIDPSLLTVTINSLTDISESTFSISWTADSSIPEFQIQLTDDNFITILEDIITTNTSYSFNNLQEGTYYCVRIRPVLGTTFGTWTTICTFTSDYVFLYNMVEHNGNTLEDSSVTPYNPGYIYPITDSSTIFDLYMNEGSGSILEDTTLNNNDGNINNNPPTIINTTIFNYNMNEGSGSILEDTTLNNNDGTIGAV